MEVSKAAKMTKLGKKLKHAGIFLEKENVSFVLINTPNIGQARQIVNMLMKCSPPRKSLVKGERFIRFEEEQQLLKISSARRLLFIHSI